MAPLKVNVLTFVVATIPPLREVSVNGFATVIEAVERSVPPDKVTEPVGLFRFVGLEIDKTPAAIVVPPV
jgi:hypothetical protein